VEDKKEKATGEEEPVEGSSCYGKSNKVDRADRCLEKGSVHKPKGLMENTIARNAMKEASCILSRHR
jgi:hypothetical protein